MYKGTPDKNPGVSSPKNDETMKAPGQGSGPAQMQKPGEQSGQQCESGPVYSKNQGDRETGSGNENPGKMSRDGPGSGPQSQDCPGSGSQNNAGGHGGRIQGQEQMSQAPVGHESGPSDCGCPCMKKSGRQQGTDNGPSGKADRELSDKSRWAPEESGNGPRGGAIGQDRSYQGPAIKDKEAFHHRFTNPGKHERSGCTDREGSGEKEVYLIVTEKC